MSNSLVNVCDISSKLTIKYLIEVYEYKMVQKYIENIVYGAIEIPTKYGKHFTQIKEVIVKDNSRYEIQTYGNYINHDSCNIIGNKYFNEFIFKKNDVCYGYSKYSEIIKNVYYILYDHDNKIHNDDVSNEIDIENIKKFIDISYINVFDRLFAFLKINKILHRFVKIKEKLIDTKLDFKIIDYYSSGEPFYPYAHQYYDMYFFEVKYIEINESIINYLRYINKNEMADKLQEEFTNIKCDEKLSYDELMDLKVKELMSLDLDNYFKVLPNRKTKLRGN